MKKLLIFIFLFFLTTGSLTWADTNEAEYIIGVVPQYTVVATYESWTPFIDYLSEKTGIKAKLKLSKSISEFEKNCMSGLFDFAFMNPYQQVKSREKQGYIPLAHDGSNKLIGIIVVGKDSPIQSVKELDGQTIAFPAPNAFAASLYIRALLAEQEKISFTPEYLKTHDNVYRHVISGKVKAGGGVRGTLKKQPLEAQEELRVLYETPGVTPHPFSAHPRVPAKVQQDVVAAILELSKTPEGQKILEAIQMPKPVQADYERDYRSVEDMKLEKYYVSDSE